jgi:hypothetical protein
MQEKCSEKIQVRDVAARLDFRRSGTPGCRALLKPKNLTRHFCAGK